MGIAVAYCRVSTKKQEEALKDHQEQWDEIFAKEGYSFANTGVFFKKNGYNEPRKGLYIDEGISAKEYKRHRKAFQQMLQDAMSGKFKQIFVEDTTRFARSVEDGIKIIKDLREKGVDVYFRKETIHSMDPSQDMFLSVYFTIAENEIRTDSNRLKWKQDRLHRAGKWTAPAPYGYSVEKGNLSKNDEEASKVDFIFYLYTERLQGMRCIANYLNSVKGWRTRKNQLWKSTEIRYILKNPMYIGDIVNHRTESVDITRGTSKKIPKADQIVVHNEELRIIDDETWDKKEYILKHRNEKLKDRKGHSTKHLLSTLLYCEECGSAYIRVGRKKTKNKKAGHTWTCLGHNHYGDIKCKGRYSLEEEELNKFVIEELKEEQKRDRKIYLDVYLKKKKEELSKINIGALEEEKEDKQLQIIQARTDKNKKKISQETYDEQIKSLNKRIDEIRKLQNDYNNLNIDIERAKNRYELRNQILSNLDFNKLDNIDLKQIFNKIIIRGEYENGNKYIYIHFGYNFIDDTITELGRELDETEHAAFEYFKPFQVQKIRKSTKTRYFNNKGEI